MSRDFINLASLTVSHLKQVIDKVSTFKEEDLVRLDQTINTYLLKRRQSKISIQQQQSFESRMRAQLMALEEKNDYILKELDITTHNFQKEKQQVRKANCQWKADNEQYNEDNIYEELIKELIQELIPYKKITYYLQRFQSIKKDSMDNNIYATYVHQYFQKVDEIVSNDQHQDIIDDLTETEFYPRQ